MHRYFSALVPRPTAPGRRLRGGWNPAWSALGAVLLALIPSGGLSGQVRVDFAQPPPDARILVSADSIERFRQGAWDVFLIRNPQIQHGTNRYYAGSGVLWVDPQATGPSDVLLYLEQNVAIDLATGSGQPGTDRVTDSEWFGRLRTGNGVHLQTVVVEIAPEAAGDLFARGMARRQLELQPVQPVQYVVGQDSGGLSVISPVTGGVRQLDGGFRQTDEPSLLPPGQPSVLPPPRPGYGTPATGNRGLTPGSGSTRVRIISRNSSVGGNIKKIPSGVPGEEIWLYTGGVRVNIDSEQLGQLDQFGQPRTRRLVIQADNVVAWINPVVNPDGSGGSRYELYLEGNVVFAMGNRVIYADRMYYDAAFQRGTILSADVLTPVPSYQGLVRLKADVVQQLDENRLQAFGAAITSSRLGVPRYWLQSNTVTLTRQDRSIVDPASGVALVDPDTGLPATGDRFVAESRANSVWLGGLPVFYWPVLRTELDNPNYYIERVRIGNDSVFGFQVGVGLDVFQLLGIPNRPENVRWVYQIDYLSKRGVGYGSDVDYAGRSFFGIDGLADGRTRSWFIHDSGEDNLGRDRRAVPPETRFRGKVLAQHRHVFSRGGVLRGEIGWLSDRNFLEEYFEREWDQHKDFTTGLWYQRNFDNQSLNLVANGIVNDFFTQTAWLPRIDHYIIGQPLLFDRLLWHGKSTVSYAKFKAPTPPTNAVDLAKFDPLAWNRFDREGVVAGTRQEIDLPFRVGPVKVVPYLLGDASYWQQNLEAKEFFRVYGQAGLRTSLPMWQVDPSIQSTLLNLNGLAHKVNWETEVFYADADGGYLNLPLYNELDDESQEVSRGRFKFDTFGLKVGEYVPLRVDERTFAFRSATQSYVTSPAMEIADNLAVIRTGFHNRWQTKRGVPGEARIIDWITFDVDASFFPDAARDNFGAHVGLVQYDFRWHIGDRLSLVSDGFFDFFYQGLRTTSLGAYTSRPGVGNLYMGLRSIEGPISSNVLTGAAAYRMSDKWIVRAAGSYDFGSNGNTGQSLGLIRIGESFLVKAGVSGDVSRDNVSFVFGVEPRFLPSGRLGLVGGQRILPASTNWLE